ncbi:TPA: methyltransferase domain-containing protein [Legionella pneumophila]|jgi:ubiquinone/menaquinone biosynthesis C-methylase UbiE|nr:class I SAM-dependent methyltransferase [Legionella pneumophila]MDW9166677.1 methyltransferase domain-containing protein [Legionella pneumophila subsp. fraseri]MDX1845831.1 methyltransferase domain-containing protein [Legionella pneumophila subsp. fraseri]HAT1771492.1 methyltransferase domain-containing protein [Legionella pneumophila]HAT1973072.1 methyltransferase domain-containing protein [Legionella pneumophila]HAT2135400.1 methyltransferase domain-containing protein [Legionella pneumoph
MTSTYILNTNDKARERLSLQHQLYAKSSLDLLAEIGFPGKMTALEIGCGSGDMTLELAKLIGPESTLLTMDLSPDQLDYTQQRTRAYSNIRFKLWDVNHLSDLGEKFDLIYCRMVLHHVADARSVILQMKNCLNSGGFVVCEEPSLFDSTFCSPPSPSYDQFTQWAKLCFSKSNRDFQIAHRLEQEFSSCGFEIKHCSLFQPLLRTHKEKLIYSMALDDLTPRLLELGIAKREEIEQLHDELKDLAKTNSTMCWIRMHRIIAKRNE